MLRRIYLLVKLLRKITLELGIHWTSYYNDNLSLLYLNVLYT